MCDATPRSEVVLSADPTAPAAARAFVRRSGCATHVLSPLEDVVLLVSELVTNAVRHGAPPIVLVVECHRDVVRVSVGDGDGERLPRAVQADDEAEGGRGVVLVDLLSDAWGVAEAGGTLGKQVWFTVRTGPADPQGPVAARGG